MKIYTYVWKFLLKIHLLNPSAKIASIELQILHSAVNQMAANKQIGFTSAGKSL